MPTTVNGIGTHYYGKKNLEKETGLCEFCGSNTQLSTYETGLYVVFVFIPIIPLGRRQILDECAVCQRHRVISAEKWKKIREEAIESSTAQLADKMNDAEAAIEHLKTLTAFRQLEDARDLVPAIESTHPDSLDVQFYLGAWHEKYGQPADADRCFDRAFEIDPSNPHAIRAKGIGLIEKGMLEQADQMFKPLQSPSPNYDPAVFYRLATAYQDNDQHPEAVGTFKQIVEASPEFGRDATFRKAVLKSERASGAAESILPKRSIFASRKLKWAAALLLIFGILMGATIWIGQNRTVHVVNGAGAPLTVKIDDAEPMTISPGLHKIVQLAEGQHQIELLSPIETPAKSFRFSSSIWTRFFNNPVVVLDPAETSVVIWEETTYAEHAHVADDKFKLHIGKLITDYEDVDFAFKPFPQSIEVENSGSRVSRTRVSFQPITPEALLPGGVDLPANERLKIVERLISYAPGSREMWATYVDIAQSENQTQRCIEFMEPKLDQRPIDVELHRAYQAILLSREQQSSLIERYDRYLASEPDNSNLLYLRGRLEPNNKNSIQYFSDALDADPKNTFAIFAIGYNEFAAGNFQMAKQRFQMALDLKPNDQQYQISLIDTLFATKDYQTLQKFVNMRPTSMPEFQLATKLLKLTNRENEYPGLRNALLTGERGQELEAGADLYWAYLRDDMPAYQQAIAKLPTQIEQQIYQIFHDIETEDVAEASKFVKSFPPELALRINPLIAIVLKRTGQTEQAQQIWHDALDQLKTRGNQQFATLARKSETEKVTLDEFQDISIESDLKRVLGLGLREFSADPDPKLDDEIRKLNFDLAFPHNFIAKSLEQK